MKVFFAFIFLSFASFFSFCSIIAPKSFSLDPATQQESGGRLWRWPVRHKKQSRCNNCMYIKNPRDTRSKRNARISWRICWECRLLTDKQVLIHDIPLSFGLLVYQLSLRSLIFFVTEKEMLSNFRIKRFFLRFNLLADYLGSYQSLL